MAHELVAHGIGIIYAIGVLAAHNPKAALALTMCNEGYESDTLAVRDACSSI